jgi:A/G-specific adenine glycosylase
MRAGLYPLAVDFGPALMAWYRPRERLYPWRRSRPDPYRILVSEVMLQQTQASRVVPIYRSFLRRFPSVRALAEAERADVIRAWNGLGYNRRAVALSEAARTIVSTFGGKIPRHPDELCSLPGVGPYTAAAVASMAFGLRVPALDTNVRRVVARFVLGAEPTEVGASAVGGAAAELMDGPDPGRWNQAVMDLGRAVCRPAPRCGSCPVAGGCRYRRAGRRGGSALRRQGAFEGSFRQLRGAVVRALATGRPRTVATIAALANQPTERVVLALRALASDGMVWAGPKALAGDPRGRVRLG